LAEEVHGPRARETRRFLNENLAKVPQDHQLVLYRALHERWHSDD
jgi:hypothetical protein